jgi:hypothetical protein
MGDELPNLVKGAWIQQQIDTLTSGQLATGMLRFDSAFASAQLGALIQLMKPL